MRVSLRSLVVFGVGVSASMSQGAVLFSQPNQVANGYFSDSVAYGPGVTFFEQAVADNFTLASASNVNQIVFWGSGEGIFFPGLNNLAGLKVNVYDASWALVSTNSVATAALTPTATGNTNSSNGAEYRFTFNTNLALGAGTYWLHVGGSYVAPLDDAFVWSSNTTQGDGQSAFANLAVNQTFVQGPNAVSGTNYDQAFEIRGDAVPEPATMAALGLGLAALLRRRK